MDWKAILTALRTIFAAMLADSVKAVALLEAPRPMVVGTIGLIHVTTSVGLGVDETRYEETATELLPSQCGNRMFTLQFRAEHPNQDDPSNARNACERARTRIRRQSVRDALLSAGLSLATVGPMVDVTYDYDGHRVSAATLDFIFNAVADERDEAIPFIETVELSTDLQDEAGVSYPPPMQLDEEIIP